MGMSTQNPLALPAKVFLPLRTICRHYEWLSTPSWRVGKVVKNDSVCMGIWWQITLNFPDKLNFAQFVYHNVKIQLGRRLYSMSLKDVVWLEDAQLIFLIFETFVCYFFPWTASRCMSIQPTLRFLGNTIDCFPQDQSLRVNYDIYLFY